MRTNNIKVPTTDQQATSKMCFYDQYVYQCKDYKWGNFRVHCNKEYRTGETCGMKLVHDTHQLVDKCKPCQAIDKKLRRIAKEEENLARWYFRASVSPSETGQFQLTCRRTREPAKYRASIDKARATIVEVRNELAALLKEKDRRATSFRY